MKCASPSKAASAFSSALRRIKPPPPEVKSDFEAAHFLISRLRSAVPSSVEVVLAGSLAKGTNLSGNREFDIFLLFPQHYPHHEMALLGLSYARKAFAGMRTESRYAEHPYLQVFHGNYRADIVPAYRISEISQKGSAVDRSPLHTAFVNSRLGAEGKDEVRLLKRFMKNFGIYGAELRTEGFSGYLCELLIIRHGSLLSLMEHASGWKEPAITFDGETGEKAREKFSSPLIVIDPVDPGRNVAAVVAQASLSRFIFECRRFLRSPSAAFFHSEKKPRTVGQIGASMRLRETRCLLLTFPAPIVVPDVLWPQLKKTAQALSRRLSSLGFSTFGCCHWSDGKECAVLFELDRWELPAVAKLMGPAIAFHSDTDAFVKKHSRALNLHLEHDRMVAVEKREIRTAGPALKEACRRPQGLGIPQRMEGALSRAALLSGRAMLREKYRGMLSDYFFAKIA